jgi:hypothetical protein
MTIYCRRYSGVRFFSPFEISGVLEHVLTFSGAGSHLYISAVCRDWRDAFKSSINNAQKDSSSRHMRLKDDTCQKTDFSRIFASPGCVRLAAACGLPLDGPNTLRMQFFAGQYADIATLLAAQELGLRLDAVIIGAAHAGSVTKLKWLHSALGCSFDEFTMRTAAGSGQLSACQYLHSVGCPWSASACKFAACGSHMDTLRWLHQSGCPWDAAAISSEAARAGRVGVMAYLHQQGVLTAAAVTHMLLLAGVYNQLTAAQWLRQQAGAEWPPVLQWRQRSWQGAVLVWARAEGCTALTQQLLEL